MTYDRWDTVNVEVDDGVAWVELNRPDKRNAMNPALNASMIEVLEAVDADEDARVMVLTGAGESFSAGMDLKEYFREVDEAPDHVQRKVRRDANLWQWRMLRSYPKPTIAMVNGWCFGGAFTPARGLRPRDRLGRRHLRPLRDQLGHPAGQRGRTGRSPRRSGRATRSST